MPETKIILIEPNLKDAEDFLNIGKENNWKVTHLTNSFKALQIVKNEADSNWLLLASDFSEPLKPAQLKSYLNDIKTSRTHVIEIKTANNEELNSNIVQLSKPYNATTVEAINYHLKESANLLKPQPYSLTYLNELSNNDETFIKKILKTFVLTVGEKMDEMETLAVNENTDINAIKEISHTVKPSFEMLINHTGKELCQAILNNGAPEDKMSSYVLALKEEYKKIVTSISKDYPNLLDA
ncbi:hypothetical protein ACJOV8_007280 [Formosa sp. 3Alg 14/1]|uniref:hypothetical protein n=1 Tax=Formosa sp. 3Alg 14/1 TaxID=3382190 RepID=UPI0039BDED78